MSARAAARIFAVAVAFAACGPAWAQTGIARTKHNLTATGPGLVRSSAQSGTCAFCHVQHNAAPTRGLWSGKLPAVTYQIYASSTLRAHVDQPTGSSRLCLSCHDGVLAMANPRTVAKTKDAGWLGRLTGRSDLGRDLSSSHPISFVYDSALALRRGDLADPATLPATVRLDDKRQVQCTSCHDPHEDRQSDFLRVENRSGALCLACHRPKGWKSSAHATSGATWNGRGASPWPESAFASVSQNACQSCHRSHGAAHPERLLARADETANCTVCHAGSVAAKNVASEFLKPLHHPIDESAWVHDPAESPLNMPPHVACADCHNAHAANGAPGIAPAVPGSLRGVAGLTLAGTPVAEATFEYEVCAKCHGVREPTSPGILRQSGTRNIRLKIDPSNASYHPVATAGANRGVRGLEPGYTVSSLITCTSCHNNDDWTPGGASPRGPHGSRFEPLIAREYQMNDPNVESYQNYGLCYGCHNRTFLITDQAGTFSHKLHVADRKAPCAACHDAHGSRVNGHLIDFMLRDRTGKPVVSPSSTQHRLQYVSLGPGRGQCYLSCHGVNHEPKSYP